MFLLRVALPDVPGSLGLVASALGTVDADIFAVEIVEKLEGYAIDDFMVSLPPGVLAEALVSACTGLEGVEVLWVSYYPEAWGLQPDVDLLTQMSEHPERAESLLCQNAPDVFHVAWALILDRKSGRVLERTNVAPDLTPEAVAALGSLHQCGTQEMPAGWLPGWNDTIIAVSPIRGGSHSIVLGRHGGPEFLASELARLRYLATLAFSH